MSAREPKVLTDSRIAHHHLDTVSEHPVGMLLRALEHFELNSQSVCKGLPMPLQGDTVPRLPWDAFATFVDRIVDSVGIEQLRLFCANPKKLLPQSMRYVEALVNPARLYHFVGRRLGPTMYPMFRCGYRPFDGHTLEISLTLRDGFRPCQNFFDINGYALAGLPGSLGMQPAICDAKVSGQGGLYVVTPPQSRTWAADLKRRLRGWFRSRAIAEISRDKEQLIGVYEALWRARESASSPPFDVIQLARKVCRETTDAALLLGPVGVVPLNLAAEVLLAADYPLPTRATECHSETHEIEQLDGGTSLMIVREAAARIAVRTALAARHWQLTERQGQVLREVLQGKGNKEIAAALGCSMKTVESHMTTLLQRAGTDSRSGVVVKAMELG